MTAEGDGEVDNGESGEFLVTTEEVPEVPPDLEVVIKAAEEGNVGALRDALGKRNKFFPVSVLGGGGSFHIPFATLHFSGALHQQQL